jgi:peptide/nickel transport system substrate-binding protein
MKKTFLILATVCLLGALLVTGCGGGTTTTTTSQPTATTTTTTQQTTTSAPATTTTTMTTPVGVQPEYGGTMRAIAGAIPKVLGYSPEKAPSDTYYMLPVLERLAEWNPDGTLKPVLAMSYEIDPNAMTITWGLRENIKFTDGTDFDAEALMWNFQLGIDAASLTDAQYIDSMEVTGKYTLVMHMNTVRWNMVSNYTLAQPVSPTAFETAGGTIAAGSDEEASIEWARANAVGTGPFTVSEWVRDDHITFVKNPDYWMKDEMGGSLPYLDGIEMRYIPDALVAAASLEGDEADIWMETNSVDNILDLQGKGMGVNFGPGMFNLLLMSSADENNPLSNIKVREAIEYALDRPAMAETLGQGLYEPLHQMASSTWPGYVEGYDPRPYDPEMAKQLLEEAGYPNGLQLQIMATSTAGDAMALLQYYLGEVGIVVEPDIADLGRYFGAVFGTGWQDIVLTASGINPDGTDLFVHFGPNPLTFKTTNIWKSQAFIDLCDAALAPGVTSSTQAMPYIKEAIKQAGEDCLFIPLWRSINACIYQPYVHTEYIKIHGITWDPWQDWMEAH